MADSQKLSPMEHYNVLVERQADERQKLAEEEMR